jgi:hypothetical protein
MMSGAAGAKSSKRVLEPIERISEVLFGLIMVLTFTGSLSAAESGRAEVRVMLIGALGCNLAWGLIDGIMYLMASLSERAVDLRTITAMRRAETEEEAKRVIAHALPPLVASVLTPADLGRIHAGLAQVAIPGRPKLTTRDWLGALAVFLLVVASTIPVVLPFIFLSDAVTALRVSNAIAVAMMFVAGYAFGQVAGYRPLVTGGSMVLLGSLLVALTIALGG